MQLTNDGLDEHVAAVAGLLERYGVSLDVNALGVIVEETPLGNAVFELRGFLPDGRQPPASAVAIREVWSRTGPDACERAEYEYELLDYERDVRRAFHLHDAEWFIERHQVVVHEHCEHPIGVAPCQHFEGSPIRDAFAAVMRLIEVWTDPEVPDCRGSGDRFDLELDGQIGLRHRRSPRCHAWTTAYRVARSRG